MQGNSDNSLDAMGTMGTLEQMVKVLGFHDLSSFLMVAFFGLVALAFVISCGIFLFKKRQERLSDLYKVVSQVQKEGIEAVPLEKPLPPVQELPLEPKVVAKAEELAPPIEQPLAPIDKAPLKKVKAVSAKAKVPKKPVAQAPAPKESKPEEVLPALSLQEPPMVVANVEEPKREEAVEEAPIEAPPVKTRVELGAALGPTRKGFIARLASLFSRGVGISDEDFEELEAILFSADIGVKTAQKLLEALRERVRAEKISDKAFLRAVIKEEMHKILKSAIKPADNSSFSPQVIMFVGVNGAGKTTSIGKLGAKLAQSGSRVVFGAGDTFRAAAVEQLSIWGKRIGAEVVSGKENADSASVLFDAIDKAKSAQADFVLCDTAGRLHTKTSLMDELKKVYKVIGKAQEKAPHEVFLVIDATMGQNALLQAKEFAAATPLTGVILSKLDGTAKGGVAFGIVDELKVPIRYIGIGEQVADLRDFDAEQFIDALFDEV